MNSISQRGFDVGTWKQRPFRHPHHTASGVALVGGGGQANHLDYLYASGFLKLIGSPWHFNALAQEFTQKYWVHGHMFGSEGLDFEANPHSSEVLLVLGSNPWMSAGFQRTRELLKEIAKDPERTLIVIDPRRTRPPEGPTLTCRSGRVPISTSCWRCST